MRSTGWSGSLIAALIWALTAQAFAQDAGGPTEGTPPGGTASPGPADAGSALPVPVPATDAARPALDDADDDEDEDEEDERERRERRERRKRLRQERRARLAAEREERLAEKSAPGPSHRGFTLELGVGVAYTNVYGANAATYRADKFGLAPLSLSLGGFLTPQLALMFRMAGTSYFLGELGSDSMEQVGNAFYGAVVQYYLTDQFFLGAGLGLGILGSNPFLGAGSLTSSLRGLGLTARGGFNFVTLKHHSFAVTLELFPGFFRRTRTFGTAINVQWQYH